MKTWERYQASYREQQEAARLRAERERLAAAEAKRKAREDIRATVVAALGPLSEEWEIEPLVDGDPHAGFLQGGVCRFHLRPNFAHPFTEEFLVHGWWYSYAPTACAHDDEGESCTEACQRTAAGVKREHLLLRCETPRVQEQHVFWPGDEVVAAGGARADAEAALAAMLGEWAALQQECARRQVAMAGVSA